MPSDLQIVFVTDKGARLVQEAERVKEFPPEEDVRAKLEPETAADHAGERVVRTEMWESGNLVAMRVWPEHALLVLSRDIRLCLRWRLSIEGPDA